MIVVIPVDSNKGNTVSNSFGRCTYFLIYNTLTKERTYELNNSQNSSGGAGIAAAQQVLDLSGTVLITPRCGQNAYDVLTRGNVEVYEAQDISVDKNLALLEEGKLAMLSTISKGHHGQGHN